MLKKGRVIEVTLGKKRMLQVFSHGCVTTSPICKKALFSDINEVRTYQRVPRLLYVGNLLFLLGVLSQSAWVAKKLQRGRWLIILMNTRRGLGVY